MAHPAPCAVADPLGDHFAQAVADNIAIGRGPRSARLRRFWDQLPTRAQHGQSLQLETSHWLGEAHLRGKKHSWTLSIPLAEILVEHSTYTDRLKLKGRIVAAALVPYPCALCGVAEWLGRPLVLKLDHINGVGDDNRIENLRLLYANCHSQTST